MVVSLVNPYVKLSQMVKYESCVHPITFKNLNFAEQPFPAPEFLAVHPITPKKWISGRLYKFLKKALTNKWSWPLGYLGQHQLLWRPPHLWNRICNGQLRWGDMNVNKWDTLARFDDLAILKFWFKNWPSRLYQSDRKGMWSGS